MLSRGAWTRGSSLADPGGIIGFGPVACSPTGLCVGVLDQGNSDTPAMVEVAAPRS